PSLYPFGLSSRRPAALSALSLHDALPIYGGDVGVREGHQLEAGAALLEVVNLGAVGRVVVDRDEHRQAQPDHGLQLGDAHEEAADRKSTRLNSSHVKISYAVFCLKKKQET